MDEHTRVAPDHLAATIAELHQVIAALTQRVTVLETRLTNLADHARNVEFDTRQRFEQIERSHR